MDIPEGLTEPEVLNIIQRTVLYLAPTFKFGYYDIDDMRQEGTIFCIEALPSFNFDKSSQSEISDALLTFLKTHVRWRFLNMRRKQLSRAEPPVCNCNLCVNDCANRLDCKKYSNWIKRNMSKRSLMEPFDVDEVYDTDASLEVDVESNVISSEIKDILNMYISSDFRVDYRKYIEGVKITKGKKDKLFHEIKRILKEHYSANISDWYDNEDR